MSLWMSLCFLDVQIMWHGMLVRMCIAMHMMHTKNVQINVHQNHKELAIQSKVHETMEKKMKDLQKWKCRRI